MKSALLPSVHKNYIPVDSKTALLEQYNSIFTNFKSLPKYQGNMLFILVMPASDALNFASAKSCS